MLWEYKMIIKNKYFPAIIVFMIVFIFSWIADIMFRYTLENSHDLWLEITKVAWAYLFFSIPLMIFFWARNRERDE